MQNAKCRMQIGRVFDFMRPAFCIVHLALRMTRSCKTPRLVVPGRGAFSARLLWCPAHPELIAADDGLNDR